MESKYLTIFESNEGVGLKPVTILNWANSAQQRGRVVYLAGVHLPQAVERGASVTPKSACEIGEPLVDCREVPFCKPAGALNKSFLEEGIAPASILGDVRDDGTPAGRQAPDRNVA
jgi:hypothetical protein